MNVATMTPSGLAAALERFPVRVQMQLRGHVPAKKNNWRPRKGGGMMLLGHNGEDIKALCSSLEMQARSFWRIACRAEPARACLVMAHFSTSHHTPDPDNRWTTLLDCLKKAGVIHDDNGAALAGMSLYTWSQDAESKGEESTTVYILEAA